MVRLTPWTTDEFKHIRFLTGSETGLTRPTQNFLVLQLLENYIPMVFSTLLEPFLTLLNRLLALLQPYYDLQKGRRPARRTIETRYDSVPPQLNILRAGLTGHYLLSLLSFVVLLGSVLSVALGAIFNESPVSVETTLNVTALKTSVLARNTVLPHNVGKYENTWFYFDHFYMVQTNLSNRAQLPAWIDEEFAYLPFADTTSHHNRSAEYTATTRGFGMAAHCSVLSQSNISAAYVSYDYNSTVTYGGYPQQEQTLAVTYADRNYTCIPGSFSANLEMPTGGVSPSAQEVYSYLTSARGTADEADFCEQRLLVGWLRYEQGQPAGYQPRASWMGCTSEFRTARFTVTVDAGGHVLRSARAGPYDNITEVLGGNGTAARRLWRDVNMYVGGYGTNTASSAGADLGWHNDTLTRDWMNYLLKMVIATTTNNTTTTNNSSSSSTALVDSREPVPEVMMAYGSDNTTLATTVEMLYQRASAALLGANHRGIFADAESPALTSTTMTTTTANDNNTLPAVMVTSDTRIFMDDTAYTITTTILGIYLVTVAWFYLAQAGGINKSSPSPFSSLPRMPSTIGSVVAYVAASRAVRVYHQQQQRPRSDNSSKGGGKSEPGGGQQQWLEGAGAAPATYSFGRYTGLDGKVHVGIELDPYVVPSMQQGKKKKKRPKRFVFW